jgi:hypothetical protein
MRSHTTSVGGLNDWYRSPSYTVPAPSLNTYPLTCPTGEASYASQVEASEAATSREADAGRGNGGLANGRCGRTLVSLYSEAQPNRRAVTVTSVSAFRLTRLCTVVYCSMRTHVEGLRTVVVVV